MRYLLVLLVLMAPAFQSYAQNGYTLNLNFTGFKDGTKIRLVNLDLGDVIDSSVFNNGKLVFHGKVKELTAARMHTDDGRYLVVYLENKPINIKGDASDFQYAKINGTETNELEVISRDWQKPYNKERDSLMSKYFTLGDADSLEQRRVIQRVNTIDQTIGQYRLDNIRHGKPTQHTLIELFFIRTDLAQDTLKALFAKFPMALKATKHGRAITDYLANKKPVTGMMAADVSAKDKNGKTIRLSDYKGKYVLLEFWASWCGPCRSENPVLIKTYEEYHPKGLEVLAISIDASRESWLSAVMKDRLPWVNINDQDGFYGKAVAIYHVRGIPQNFLIGPDGTIAAINLRGERLGAKLKSLLGK
ncbi:MAG: hypothetical protein DI535_01785 [Citrobacter freundii]|nr:MAG: hypothetical protein DI535_01785 [Citrobacter freundii]